MASKKRYALYKSDASNYNRLVTTDAQGKPFLTELDAKNYAKGIYGASVYLLTLSKDIELLKP